MQRFNSYNSFMREKFGQKIYKLSLSISNTCPNRDGSVGVGGCSFCAGGSGEFAGDCKKSVPAQIIDAKNKVSAKAGDGKYIAYFQSYTSTYVPPQKLRDSINEALACPDIVGISIATRADCLGREVMEILKEVSQKNYLTVELGLQTVHNKTAALINRCCPLEKYIEATRKLKEIGADVVYHVILGLPQETEQMMLETVRFAAEQKVSGIKLQLLHLLRGTPMCQMYENGEFDTLSLPKYCELLGKAIEILPPETVVHRLTGDAPKRLLVAPEWSADKKKVLNTINKYFEDNNIVQGTKVQKDT